MNEPSVLDFIRSKLFPGRYPKVEIPNGLSSDSTASNETREPNDTDLIVHEEEYTSQSSELIDPDQKTSPQLSPWPWFAFISLVFAVLAQISLEPGPSRSWIPGVVLFSVAIVLTITANFRRELSLPDYSQVLVITENLKIKIYPLFGGFLLAVFAFLSSHGNQFTILNLGLLILSVSLFVWAFWIPKEKTEENINPKRTLFPQEGWKIKIPIWTILLIIAFGLALFFRYYRISDVPLEMNSDHAEKILDVMRVLDGQTMIFFPTNGGREALQFYLVAGLYQIFKIPLDFTALKLVTVTIGFLSLPFIYLLGRDLFNKRVGLFALLFTGVAYWPNVVSRAGMRLPFYILFTSIIFYYLMKGIRSGQRNFFIIAGITLGLSFYGYSADRILPLLVLSAVIIFSLHRQTKTHRNQVLSGTVILFIIAAVIFLPMLRYMLEDPNNFLFRTLTRMSPMERALTASPISIFFDNFKNSLLMFSWNNGVVWPVSIPHRPALDIITGALLITGITLLIVRYIRRRYWIDLLILCSIPILLLPSVLALAFPTENPNLYRTGGVIIPVFIIIAAYVDSIWTSFSTHPGRIGPKLGWVLAILLIGLSAVSSYGLVFQTYNNQYKLSAWNSSEMGKIVESFTDSFGEIENVWVMAYPHWVDTRLIGMLSGYPNKDFVVFPDELEKIPENQELKLFIIKPEDEISISLLAEKYPDGWFEEYVSRTVTKNFLLFIVPQSVE